MFQQESASVQTAELLRRGYHVFGSVRKAADADRLQMQFGEAFSPLLFDVTDGRAIGTAVEQVQDVVGDNGLCALINNAGILTPGPLLFTPLEDFRTQFEVNLFGLLDVTQQFLPLLGARKGCAPPSGSCYQYQFSQWQDSLPIYGGLCGNETRAGSVIRLLTSRTDALRR